MFVSQIIALFLIKLLKFNLKIIMLHYQIFSINSQFMAINLISITHGIHMSPVGFLYGNTCSNIYIYIILSSILSGYNNNCYNTSWCLLNDSDIIV